MEKYWPNRQLWIKGSYIKGLKDGIWMEFSSGGDIYQTRSYKLGKKDGEWKDYNSKGNLSLKRMYKNGFLNGVF